MKIAVFGRKLEKGFEQGLKVFFDKINQVASEVYIYEPFYEFLKTNSTLNIIPSQTFNSHLQVKSDFNFFFSFGGDGTFLEAVRYVRDTKVPIIGINTGRLGFLANVAQEDISQSIDMLFGGNFTIEERSLIKFDSSSNPFIDFPYGLNEFTVQKRDSSLITIDTKINDSYLNTYWTDGLIISTPTGSTAYSMSVGGPIVAPDCRALIISPIASHNLTVRPIVITDNNIIKLKIEGRSKHFMATLDSHSYEFDTGAELELKLADFSISIVRLTGHSFYKTIRKKLMWGADIRN